LHFVQDLLIFNSIRDFLINIHNFLPFLSLDEGSPLFKPIDDLGIVECKGDLGDLNVLLPWTIYSLVREVVESLLQLELHEELELLHLPDGIGRI
jgi:hypothetical protein